jgi:hypothetical protein
MTKDASNPPREKQLPMTRNNQVNKQKGRATFMLCNTPLEMQKQMAIRYIDNCTNSSSEWMKLPSITQHVIKLDKQQQQQLSGIDTVKSTTNTCRKLPGQSSAV